MKKIILLWKRASWGRSKVGLRVKMFSKCAKFAQITQKWSFVIELPHYVQHFIHIKISLLDEMLKMFGRKKKLKKKKKLY